MKQTKNRMLSEILEVKELARPQDVNAHIKQGWQLLDTYKISAQHEKQAIKYCVGWPKSAGAISSSQNKIPERSKFIYSF
jgi:hypothetical protein